MVRRIARGDFHGPRATSRATPRYAVYYAPPADSPLAALGAAWLGWDAEAGVEVAAYGPVALAGVRSALVKRARGATASTRR
jgi:hypothetical protein